MEIRASYKGGEFKNMIILQTKGEKQINKAIKWILAKNDINIIKTGLDKQMLDLLIEIYLQPEFNHRGK